MEKLIKSSNGQWALSKGQTPDMPTPSDPSKGGDGVNEMAKDDDQKGGHSVFTMDHVRQVAGMKDHGKAKELAHGVVDSNKTALASTKSKIKGIIDRSRNTRDLAMAMSNHIMAHPSEGLKVINKSELSKEDGSEMMFSQLESVEHHLKEIRSHIKPSEDSPDWVKAKITEAAKQLSDVAHYIQGEKTVAKAGDRPTAHDRDLSSRYKDIASDPKNKGSVGKPLNIGKEQIDQAVRTVEAKYLKPKK